MNINESGLITRHWFVRFQSSARFLSTILSHIISPIQYDPYYMGHIVWAIWYNLYFCAIGSTIFRTQNVLSHRYQLLWVASNFYSRQGILAWGILTVWPYQFLPFKVIKIFGFFGMVLFNVLYELIFWPNPVKTRWIFWVKK